MGGNIMMGMMSEIRQMMDMMKTQQTAE